MRSIRWIALAALVHGMAIMFAPLSAASDVEPNQTDAKRASLWLTAALGPRTLQRSLEQSGDSDISGGIPGNLLSSEPAKSPTKAFLYSALVPGSGQLYIGAKRGYLQIAAEIGLLTAYFATHNSAENLRDDYREQVRQHVVFDGPGTFETWDPVEDFEHATLFDNWHNVYTDNNGEPLERTGKWYWADRAAFKDDERPDPDSPQRLKALDMRQNANDKFQLARTFLGITILNHVVSAIDARIAAKSYNKRYAAQAGSPRPLELNLQTTFAPDAIQSQVVLQKRF